MNVEAIKSEVLLLPKLEKIELIQLLAQSIAEEERLWQGEDEYNEELKALLFKRLKDAEAGVAKWIPIEESEMKIREKYGIPA